MASIKELIAPSQPVTIINLHTVSIDAPEVLQDEDLYHQLGLSGESDKYPFLQPVYTDPNLHGSELPLKCSVEQYELIQPTRIDYIHQVSNIPIYSQIIGSDGKDELFEGICEFQPYYDNLLVCIIPAYDALLPDDFLEDLINPFEIEISEDILNLIYPPEKVLGMNYSNRYWEETPIHLPGFEPRKKTKEGEKNIRPIHREQMAAKNVGFAVYKPSIWDLLFVLLQPPLILSIPESLPLPHDLYPYQIKGVEFLISNEHALLADDMGTGKTVMSLVALKILMQQGKVKTALIICPPSVLYEWIKHLSEWAPELVTTVVRGTKQIREATWESPSHVYLTSYSTLRNDIRSVRPPKNYKTKFDVVIVDEAHHIKNPNTAQSRTIRLLNPKYRWALTGTPVQNRIEDMMALFDFIYPGLLTSFDIEERVKNKIAPHFLRRRKQEVMPELPPKIRQQLELELDRDQQKAYVQVERESQIEIQALGYKVTKQHIFAKLTKLKQICNFAPGKNTSPKLEDLREIVEEVSQSGQKVIIFSQYIDEGINKIENGLKPYKYSKIVGGQSDIVRRQEIEKFKYTQDTPILLASVRSGGEGLNLAEASYVVHFDHWWNPAVMWQAEDRVHRRGQKNSVNIYSYWMTDTIDERIREILDRKGLLIENVVDGLAEKEIDELLSIDDLLEILGVKSATQPKSKFDSQAWRNLTFEQIRQKLYEIKPHEFEDLVQQLMHYLGFPNVTVTKRSGDGGIDVISSRNTPKGVERIAAQCKRYKGTVGVPIAREFFGAIRDDPSIVKGYIITTGEFTQECISFCIRNSIDMIPGIKVAEYVKMFSLTVPSQ